MSGGKLTKAQVGMLVELRDRPEVGQRWGWGSSSCNATGRVMERQGLARYEYDRTVPYTWGRWTITEAGRAAIQKEGGER